MTYIVNRRDRFYVIAYDGIDPISGRKRRCWHPAGTNRDDAEELSRQLERDLSSRPTLPPGRGTTLGRFLVEDWLPRKRRTLTPTTAYRYAWMIDHYVVPRLGMSIFVGFGPIISTTSTPTCCPRAAVAEAHCHPRRCSRSTYWCEAYSMTRAGGASWSTTSPPMPPGGAGGRTASCPERSWTRDQLTAFLACARDVRLYPALHVAACVHDGHLPALPARHAGRRGGALREGPRNREPAMEQNAASVSTGTR